MTKNFKNGLALAAREHLLSGLPLTRLEAIVLFGIANLPDIVKEMRRQGWIVNSRSIPYAMAVARMRDHAHLEPPKNLPVKEIMFTDYWVSR
jgi:hypothetical protein